MCDLLQSIARKLSEDGWSLRTSGQTLEAQKEAIVSSWLLGSCRVVHALRLELDAASKVISLRFWGLASPANIGAFDYAGIRGIKWEEFDGHGISRRSAIRICAKAQWKVRDVIFPCRRDEGSGVIIAE